MNLKRVKTFMLVVEHKNFSTVAQILNISQPAVSNQIKSLEEDMGISLLHRDTCEATEAGQLVVNRGKELLHIWGEMVEDCHAMQGQLTGILRIGASTIPGSYIVPTIIRKFRDRFPRVEVQLIVQESEEVLHSIRNEQLDIGFVGTNPLGDQFVKEVIERDKMILIAPIGSDDIHGFEDIKRQPFIFRGDRSGTWQATKKGFNSWSNGHSLEELHCVAKVHSTESLLSMVEAGLGFSFVSSHAAEQATKHKRVKVLAELPFEREFYLTYLKSKSHNPAIKEMVQLCT
jgi:DNA-binding transcriptional LysR family regulator